MRRGVLPWWLPLALLVLCFAVLGVRWGQGVAALTETDVIRHYAARYVAEGPEGAVPEDCAARPDPAPEVWLVIDCGRAGRMVRYRVDRLGRMVEDDRRGGPEA